MIEEKYLELFIGLLRYPGIDEVEVRDAFLNVLYGTIPNGVPVLADTPTFCIKLLSYVRQCDKEVSAMLTSVSGFPVRSDAEFNSLARFVVAGLDYGQDEITKYIA